MLLNLREGEAAPLREVAPEVDEGFAAIVTRAMEWDRTARFATAQELQVALIAWVRAQHDVTSLLTEFLDVPAPPPPPASVGPPSSRSSFRAPPTPPRMSSGSVRVSVRAEAEDPVGGSSTEEATIPKMPPARTKQVVRPRAKPGTTRTRGAPAPTPPRSADAGRDTDDEPTLVRVAPKSRPSKGTSRE